MLAQKDKILPARTVFSLPPKVARGVAGITEIGGSIRMVWVTDFA